MPHGIGQSMSGNFSSWRSPQAHVPCTRRPRLASPSPFTASRTPILRPHNRSQPRTRRTIPQALQRFYGPVQLAHVSGKGRGLVATRPLQPGELVLVSQPVGVVFEEEQQQQEGEEGLGVELAEGGDSVAAEGEEVEEQEEEEEEEHDEGEEADGGEDDEEGAPPVSALLSLMQSPGRLGPAQRLLLRLSYDGTPGSAEECPDLGTLYQRLRQLELPLQLRERGGCAEGSQGASRGSNSAGNGSDSSSSSTSMPGLTPVTAAECANAADEEETTGPCTGSGLQDAELLRLLELNCFSEPRMDPGVTVGSAAAGVPAAGPGQAEELPSEGCSHLAVDKLPAVDFLRLAVGDAGGGDGSGGNGGSGEGGDGGASQGGCRWLSRPGHTGLWVEHAWMNHSCAPNVVNYVLGESMVVRCARPVAAGQELCDTYLGNTLAAPLGVRQQALQAQYGFTCTCSRCDAEANRLAPATARRLAAAWRRVTADVTPAAVGLMRRAMAEMAGGGAEEDGEDEEGMIERCGGQVDGATGGGEEGDVGDVGQVEGGEQGEDDEAEAWVDSVVGGALAAARAAQQHGAAAAAQGATRADMGGTELEGGEAEVLGGAPGVLAQLAEGLGRLTGELRSQVAADLAGNRAAAGAGGEAPRQSGASATGSHSVTEEQEPGQRLQQQLQLQQQVLLVDQVLFAVVEAVELSAACYGVVAAALGAHAGVTSTGADGAGGPSAAGQDGKHGSQGSSSGSGNGHALVVLQSQHRAAQVRQQALALQLCAATVPGTAVHVEAALELARACVPGGWPRPGKARVGWHEWEAGLGQGSVAQWAVAEVRRALGLRYGKVEGADDTWRLADAWLADG